MRVRVMWPMKKLSVGSEWDWLAKLARSQPTIPATKTVQTTTEATPAGDWLRQLRMNSQFRPAQRRAVPCWRGRPRTTAAPTAATANDATIHCAGSDWRESWACQVDNPSVAMTSSAAQAGRRRGRCTGALCRTRREAGERAFGSPATGEYWAGVVHRMIMKWVDGDTFDT
jgi:hypothetical protein